VGASSGEIDEQYPDTNRLHVAGLDVYIMIHMYSVYTSWLYRSVRFRSDIHISARLGPREATTAGRGISMTCRADCAVSRLPFDTRSFSPLDQRRKRVSRAFCVDVERDICSTPEPLSSSPKMASSEAGRLGRPPRWSQLKKSRVLWNSSTVLPRQKFIPRVEFNEPRRTKKGMQIVAVAMPKVQ